MITLLDYIYFILIWMVVSSFFIEMIKLLVAEPIIKLFPQKNKSSLKKYNEYKRDFYLKTAFNVILISLIFLVLLITKNPLIKSYQIEVTSLLILSLFFLHIINPANIDSIKIKKTRLGKFLILNTTNKKEKTILYLLKIMKVINIILVFIVLILLFHLVLGQALIA